MAAHKYNVFLGSEIGFLKGVNSEKRLFNNLNKVNLDKDKSNEITGLRWTNEEQNQLYALTRSQTIQTYCAESGLCANTFEAAGGEGIFKGFEVLNKNFVTCTSSGCFRVWSRKKNKMLQEMDVGKDIFRMRQDPQNSSHFATGGKENCLKVWDIKNPIKPIFTAKNDRHDFLDMQTPVWVTDLRYRDDGTILVGTGYHEIRVYDTRSETRRPVVRFDFDEYPITCTALTHLDHSVMAGNTRGRVALLDLRKQRIAFVFRHFAGSVRDIAVTQSAPYRVVSCGLDRFLRVHDMATRELEAKIYVKSRLNCLAIRSDFDNVDVKETAPSSMETEQVEDSEDDEQIWEAMPEVAPEPEPETATNGRRSAKKQRRK